MADGRSCRVLTQRDSEGRTRQVDAVQGERHHVGSGDGRGVGEAVDAAAQVGHAGGRLGGAAEGEQEALAARVAPRCVCATKKRVARSSPRMAPSALAAAPKGCPERQPSAAAPGRAASTLLGRAPPAMCIGPGVDRGRNGCPHTSRARTAKVHGSRRLPPARPAPG